MAEDENHRSESFWSAEDASIEVEYVLILALVIFPLCVVIPSVIVADNTGMFRRLDFWANLPFP